MATATRIRPVFRALASAAACFITAFSSSSPGQVDDGDRQIIDPIAPSVPG